MDVINLNFFLPLSSLSPTQRHCEKGKLRLTRAFLYFFFRTARWNDNGAYGGGVVFFL